MAAIRSIKHLTLGFVAALVAVVSVNPSAQERDETIAVIRVLSGNVLVSTESGLAAGAEKQRLEKGRRVVSLSNSRALIVYDNGCEVSIIENQRFVVEDPNKICALINAQVESLLLESQALAFAPLLSPLLAGGVGSAVAIVDYRDSQAVSPN